MFQAFKHPTHNDESLDHHENDHHPESSTHDEDAHDYDRQSAQIALDIVESQQAVYIFAPIA